MFEVLDQNLNPLTSVMQVMDPSAIANDAQIVLQNDQTFLIVNLQTTIEVRHPF